MREIDIELFLVQTISIATWSHEWIYLEWKYTSSDQPLEYFGKTSDRFCIDKQTKNNNKRMDIRAKKKKKKRHHLYIIGFKTHVENPSPFGHTKNHISRCLGLDKRDTIRWKW
ncbi:unnamed protein product [Absidia cylindrospora]